MKSKNQFIFSKLFAMLSFLCLMASLIFFDNMNVSFGSLFFAVSLIFAGVSLVLGVCSEDK